MQRRWTLVITLLGIATLVGIGFFRTNGPEPIDEARTFLSLYQPLGRTLGSSTRREESISLERQAYLREEEARMKIALPKAHGWNFSRANSRFPYDVTATNSGLTRLDRLVLAVPGLRRIVSVQPFSIWINLSAYKRTQGAAHAKRVSESGKGWTRAETMFVGRSPGILAPTDNSGYLDLLGTPSGPGRQPGE